MLPLSLTLSHHTIWYFRRTALFLFILARAALSYFPTLSVKLRPLFLFQRAQYAQVFPLKPAPFCKLYAGLASINKSATSLFLLSDSRHLVLSSIFPSTSISLADLSSLSSCSIRLQWVPRPDTRFSWGTTRLMSWPDGERYSFPLQSLVVSLLLSLVSILLFSRTGGVLSHLNSSTHRFHRFPTRCSFVTLAAFSLVFAATDTAYCYLSRIGIIKIFSCSAYGNLSSHSALSSYGLFAPLTLWRLSVSLQPLVQALESCPASGAPWSSAMPPSLGRGRVTTTTTTDTTALRGKGMTRVVRFFHLIDKNLKPSKSRKIWKN